MALLLLCIDEMKITRYLACSTHNEMRQSVKIKGVMPLLCSGDSVWLHLWAIKALMRVMYPTKSCWVLFCFVTTTTLMFYTQPVWSQKHFFAFQQHRIILFFGLGWFVSHTGLFFKPLATTYPKISFLGKKTVASSL